MQGPKPACQVRKFLRIDVFANLMIFQITMQGVFWFWDGQMPAIAKHQIAHELHAYSVALCCGAWVWGECHLVGSRWNDRYQSLALTTSWFVILIKGKL